MRGSRPLMHDLGQLYTRLALFYALACIGYMGPLQAPAQPARRDHVKQRLTIRTSLLGLPHEATQYGCPHVNGIPFSVRWTDRKGQPDPQTITDELLLLPTG